MATNRTKLNIASSSYISNLLDIIAIINAIIKQTKANTIVIIISINIRYIIPNTSIHEEQAKYNIAIIPDSNIAIIPDSSIVIINFPIRHTSYINKLTYIH